jgi:inorganic pyrophosphatase/exopolyphosphatase
LFQEFALELATIADIDLHAHACAMLEAKADISHLQPEDVLMFDSKVHNEGVFGDYVQQ